MQNPPPVQMNSQPPVPAAKSSTGLDENIAALLSYVFGWLSGLIFFLIEKDSRLVRFHAMQSTATFLGVLVLNLIVLSLPLIGFALSVVFVVGVIALWAFLIIKAFRGERYKLPYVGDFAEQLLK